MESPLHNNLKKLDQKAAKNFYVVLGLDSKWQAAHPTKHCEARDPDYAAQVAGAAFVAENSAAWQPEE